MEVWTGVDMCGNPQRQSDIVLILSWGVSRSIHANANHTFLTSVSNFLDVTGCCLIQHRRMSQRMLLGASVLMASGLAWEDETLKQFSMNQFPPHTCSPHLYPHTSTPTPVPRVDQSRPLDLHFGRLAQRTTVLPAAHPRPESTCP